MGTGRLKTKLRNARGETLIEVLASVLVGALSVALLFGCAMVCVRLDRDATTADAEHAKALTDAEIQQTPAENAALFAPSVTDTRVTVTRLDGTGTPAKITVAYYGGKGAVSYKLQP